MLVHENSQGIIKCNEVCNADCGMSIAKNLKSSPRLESFFVRTANTPHGGQGIGGMPSRKKSDYYGGTIPWVKSGELNGRYITSVEEYITEEAVENSSQ